MGYVEDYFYFIAKKEYWISQKNLPKDPGLYRMSVSAVYVTYVLSEALRI